MRRKFVASFTKDDYNTIEAIANRTGWEIEYDRDENGMTMTFTDSDHDYYEGHEFTIEFDSVDDLVEQVNDRWNEFELDRETYNLLDCDGHGMDGAPYSMRDVLDEMTDFETKLSRLADRLRDIER
ncbi:MAG: hypothetical protein Q4E62_07445 [Sutterellaceae bacterium]|nr:hypothetical protein [Sutterellaceae bacterium]